jgi:hypothetical protein
MYHAWSLDLDTLISAVKDTPSFHNNEDLMKIVMKTRFRCGQAPLPCRTL